MIKRDEHGIICQHNLNYPNQMDGGDSASRTGIMAMCGSTQDRNLLFDFIHFTNRLVRHPHQGPKWNNPDETSRDQLICYSAGINAVGRSVTARHVILSYAQSSFINKDFLPPHVRWALYTAARFTPPIWIRLLAKPTMWAALIWSTKFAADEEQNQMVCLCSIYGDEWVKRLHDWHPNLFSNLMGYWDGKPWRDQKEISEAMIKFIHGKLK